MYRRRRLVDGRGFSRLMRLIGLYVLFAVIATVANLAAQRAVFAIWSLPYTLIIALGVGTLVGLFVKYVLDKNWIFVEAIEESDVKRFARYGVTGGITTTLFWGAESLAWILTESHPVREICAVMALAVGYWVKFHLDRRYVFPSRSLGGDQ